MFTQPNVFIYIFYYMYGYVHVNESAHRGQRRVSDPLELELQILNPTSIGNSRIDEALPELSKVASGPFLIPYAIISTSNKQE